MARAPLAEAPCGTDTPAAPGAPAATTAPDAAVTDFQDVDINSLQQTQPRTVDVEQVALSTLKELGFISKLTDLGLGGAIRAAILGNLIGRMAEPASELATWEWLQARSALGELIDVDFNAKSRCACTAHRIS